MFIIAVTLTIFYNYILSKLIIQVDDSYRVCRTNFNHYICLIDYDVPPGNLIKGTRIHDFVLKSPTGLYFFPISLAPHFQANSVLHTVCLISITTLQKTQKVGVLCPKSSKESSQDTKPAVCKQKYRNYLKVLVTQTGLSQSHKLTSGKVLI